jgi:hypothetical protein
MKGRWLWALLAGALVLGAFAGNVLATLPSGVSTSFVASKISFDPFDAKAHTVPADRWQARLRAHGQSDAWVVDNKIAPGGTTGWHSHPGPSLVMVIAGAVTNYSSDEPGCGGETYTAGRGFIDEGGEHVQMLRNEGDTPAQTIAVQLLPEGAERRIDKPAPEGCPR